jgi:hypothetical protein
VSLRLDCAAMRCALVLAFAMLVADTAVFAQPLSNDAAALKAEGDKAMDGLRYEDALTKYEAAYRIKPDPALLYNQGRALEGLGRFPEALDKLRAFQESAPKELLLRLGDALGKNIDELKGRVATLSISVEPAGANIRLGDRILGSAPIDKLRVNAGKAHLEITKEGFFTETLDVEIKGGEDNPLKVTLSPRDNRATLIVKSPIAGARVTIDGRARGQVPAEVRLAPGPHFVRVEQDGYQLSESTIDLAALEKRPLDVPLFKRPITQEWWLWTSIGVALTGAGVGIGLALTLEEDADEGSLDPGKVPVSLRLPNDGLVRRPPRSLPALAPPVVFWAPTVRF